MASKIKAKSPMPALGLTLGATGKGTGSIKRSLDRLLTAIVGELRGRGRELDLGTMAKVQTVLRFERACLMAQAAARKSDPSNVRHRADLMARAAHLSAKRDELLSSLGLDRPEPMDPLAKLAASLPTPSVRVLDSTAAASDTPESASCVLGHPTQSGDEVTDGH